MMTQTQLATASFNDLVFDGRNKAYGAYVLRNAYERHLRRALIIATSLFLLLILVPIVSRLLADPIADTVIHRPVTTNPDIFIIPDQPKIVPPPPAPPAPPASAAKPVATVRFVVPKISATATETEVPEIEKLAGKEIGQRDIVGPPSTAGPELTAPAEGLGGKGIVGDAVDKPEIYTYVEQMPQLPGGGGMQAIVNAIQKAVRYPAIDLRNNMEGKVYASFTVNPEGDITDIKIVRSVSETIDSETMRAIKTLPRFIPGKQNGRAVSVSFTVPISFKIQ